MGVDLIGYERRIIDACNYKLLLAYVRRHNFVPFGIYRIALALLFWVILF